MTAKQLTDSILQMAIEGKLVPQDPNDEPASVLLERIREEKRRLVKEGKLKKKELEEKPVGEDEIPFDIPENWEWCRVKTIAAKLVDGDHNPPHALSYDTGYYMLSSKNINHNKVVNLSEVRFLSYEDWQKCNERTQLAKGDILLTTVATLGRSCVYENDIPYCFQRSVSVVHTYIYNYFLKYCFDSPFYQSQINDKATGTAQRGFYLNQLEDSIIPIPPIAEQKRIVAMIEQTLPIVIDYGKAYEEASNMDAELPDKLKKSILQEAIMGKLGTQDPNDEPASVLLEQIREEKKKLVRDGVLKKKDLIEIPVGEDEVPFNIPDNWKWVRVSDMANVIMGQSPDGNDVYESLVIEDSFEFHQGKICFTEKYIAPSGKWCKKATRIAEADSLLVCVRAPIGDVNITQRNIGIGRGLSCLKGFCCISTDFLYYWMKAHKRTLVDQGTGSTFKAITVEVLKNQPIPLPPLAEQRRIVQKIEELYAEIDNMTINNTNINITKETESKE